ncbi:hypothetical protein C6P12_02545 [Weissella confusa]|uniref:hypothetical protein n=1 Tax=Weissella confusa TaxID=1583 RepID=UPI00107F381C|nr:hypothetical protein [Weissella confusa]TGE65555.1 hypothetical protein C6P12_02545 [Weissella confusa]
MDYSGNIASADAIKIVLESNRRMIDRVTETMRIAIAHTNSQSSVLIKTVSRELITKNLQPLLSQQSTMQAIVKIQSEQIAKISKQIFEINTMSLLTSQSEITIDEPNELIDEEVIVPTAIEAKTKHLITWENTSKCMQYLVKKLFEICVIEPSLKSLFDDFLLPIFFKILEWFLWLLSELW